jgi:hypothetical protein
MKVKYATAIILAAKVLKTNCTNAFEVAAEKWPGKSITFQKHFSIKAPSSPDLVL